MTSVQEPILLSSGDESEEDEDFDCLADDRPPSDEDYSSSITLSSGEDDDTDGGDELSAENTEMEVTGEEADDGEDTGQGKEASNGKEASDAEEAQVTNNGKEADNEEKAEPKESKRPKATKVTKKLPNGDKPSPKKKRKSRKKMTAEERDKAKRNRKKTYERRNIRKIIAGTKLDENTVNAQKEEEERKKRLAERSQTALDAPHLKSLLLEGGVQEPQPKNHDVVEIVSSDDDCVIVDHVDHDQTPADDESEDESNEDPENSGIHVDDEKNKLDIHGRVLVNVAHPSDDPDLFLSPQLARAVKPHQIGGIRFLYDNLVESLQRFKLSPGFGCILAHSMGLGKTLQVVSFTDVFMRYTDAKRVLIIVPINTLQNWINEYDMWLPEASNLSEGVTPAEVTPRTFNLHIINDTHKSVSSRAKVIEQWTTGGGVLLMGYEMFRLLATCKKKTRKRKATAGPEVIDMELEEKNSGLQLDMQQALLDPGPDLVICDEGHRIKNSHAGISKSLKNINTKRRVVLTGYPLQNNLIEYWCMVDFVRPNFLGTKVEFSNMFERPISNGQCADSTPQDVKLMRFRAHVLHNLLEGFVQRRNHQVLMKNLPPKEEWVLMVRMSQFQRKIYNMFMENLSLDGDSCIGGTNPLKAFAVACKIWNHPDVLRTFLDKQADTDIELDVGLSSNSALTNGKTSQKMRKSASESALTLKAGRRDSPLSSLFGISEKTAEITYDWVKPAFDGYTPGLLENSGKFVLLFQIIEHTLQLNEKLLVFSQSLITLNLVEEFLSKMPVPMPGRNETWVKNYTYYRLDGTTNASERERLIKQFNNINNRDTCLFLLSTKAGCLGINLVGANRVVMLDASWNPCHDCQAVCRVYRYGQDKPCFIYRLVTDNTMERKIYDRQVSKQGMADRVVDEIQVQSQFSKKENDQLLEYQDRDIPTVDPTGIEDKCCDPVLVRLIKDHHGWVTQSPFTHESLLIEARDQKLTKADKRQAKEAYEKEKKFSVTFSRQSYANYYQNKPPPVFRGPSLPPTSRPIVLRPSMSTPQMRTAIPFNAPSRMSAPRMIKPDVSVQTMAAPKDICVPGSVDEVIKQGELLTLIRTSKGIYIKRKGGQILSVKNRTDAESFGITERETSNTSPETTSADKMLSNLLQANKKAKIAPNIVARKLPEERTDSQPTSASSAESSASNTAPSHSALASAPLPSTHPAPVSPAPLQQTAAGQSTSGQPDSAQVASGQVVLGQVASGQVASEQAMSGQVMSGQVASGQIASGQVVSGQVVSEHVASEHVAVDQLVADTTLPYELAPLQTTASYVSQPTIDPMPSQSPYPPYHNGSMHSLPPYLSELTPHTASGQFPVNGAFPSGLGSYMQPGNGGYLPAPHPYGMPMPSPFFSGGYQSQFEQYPPLHWDGLQTSSGLAHSDPLNINRAITSSFRQAPQHFQQPELSDAHGLHNLDHISRMRNPLILPPLDNLDKKQGGYDSDSSLPSLPGDSSPT